MDDPILKKSTKPLEEFGVPVDKQKPLALPAPPISVPGVNQIEQNTKIESVGANFGKFTGGIDVRMLKPEELEGSFKAWTRKVI